MVLILDKVLEVKRLLDAGILSQRDIARQTGVSRGVVNNIASGKRGLHGRETQDEGEPVDRTASPPRRCKGCGGLVLMPCVFCAAIRYDRRQKL